MKFGGEHLFADSAVNHVGPYSYYDPFKIEQFPGWALGCGQSFMNPHAYWFYNKINKR